MNIDQANRISIVSILEIMGCRPAKETNHEAVYLSPVRNEKTASFNVHKLKNVWFDHGTGNGGRLVDLVCAWLESRGEASTVSDALRWIRMRIAISRKSALKTERRINHSLRSAGVKAC